MKHLQRKISCKLINLALCLIVLLSIGSSIALASEEGTSLQTEGNVENEAFQPEDSGQTRSNNARIMQGNTLDPYDCLKIYNGLSDGGYSSITNNGWVRNSSTTASLSINRATPDHYLSGWRNTVSYFSGHGAKNTGYPVLNYDTGNSNTQSGNFTEFNVATELGVSGSNWLADCTVPAGQYYDMRVHIIAACHQLDSTIMKYYARAMRATSMRAIAGYHETAPAHDTDTNIANSFMSYAASGESVWSSWKQSNNSYGNQPWAVLLYREYSNMYFRIPSFQGNTYSTPSSSADIYRYASHLQNTTIYQLVTRSSGAVSDNMTERSADADFDLFQSEFPLYIKVTENDRVNRSVDALQIEMRETIDTDIDVLLDRETTDDIARRFLNFSPESALLFVATPEIRTEVDPDCGAVEGSDVIVSWDQRYYNTYQNVRINNAYVYFNVDSDGIVAVINNWKDVVLGTEVQHDNYIGVREALECAVRGGYNAKDTDNVCLVYEPIENWCSDGINKLCYEFDTSDGLVRVDVETGELLNMR